MTEHSPAPRGAVAAAPDPGWYPDPYDHTVSQRWWDGQDWSEATAPLDADVSTLPGAPAGPRDVDFWSRLYKPRVDAAAHGNAPASMSIAMSILCLATAMIPHIAGQLLSVTAAVSALIWGTIGLFRALKTGVGLARAITGTFLGAVLCVIFAIGIAYLVSFTWVSGTSAWW